MKYFAEFTRRFKGWKKKLLANEQGVFSEWIIDKFSISKTLCQREKKQKPFFKTACLESLEH